MTNTARYDKLSQTTGHSDTCWRTALWIWEMHQSFLKQVHLYFVLDPHLCWWVKSFVFSEMTLRESEDWMFPPWHGWISDVQAQVQVYSTCRYYHEQSCQLHSAFGYCNINFQDNESKMRQILTTSHTTKHSLLNLPDIPWQLKLLGYASYQSHSHDFNRHMNVSKTKYHIAHIIIIKFDTCISSQTLQLNHIKLL